MTSQPIGSSMPIGASMPMDPEPFEPDVPLQPDRPPTATLLDQNASSDGGIFEGLVQAVSGASQSLESAQGAENAFAAGNGDLQSMVFERARADAMLSVASAASTKAVQSLNTILNMQV